MDNGFHRGAFQSGASGSGDYVDPNNTATWAVCDEYWGGALALGNFLGAPLSTAQGAPQTAAWSNGVWRRDFTNGIVLFNATTSSQTVSLETTYYHLRTAYGQSINNAAAVTSVTLPTFAYSNSCSGFTGTTATTGEACILMRTPT
jgi:hypothetical protein